MTCRGLFHPQATCYSLETVELLSFSGQTRLWPGSQFFWHNSWYRAMCGMEHHLPLNRCWCRQELLILTLLPKTSVNNALPGGSDVQLRFISFQANLEDEINKMMSTWKLSFRPGILGRVGLVHLLKNVHCLGSKPWVSSDKSGLKTHLGKKTLAKIPFLMSVTLIVVLVGF